MDEISKEYLQKHVMNQTPNLGTSEDIARAWEENRRIERGAAEVASQNRRRISSYILYTPWRG